jgi:hypothetical protein
MAAVLPAGTNWYVTKEQLESTPSRAAGIEKDKELSYRQQAANFIQDMGQRLRWCVMSPLLLTPFFIPT